MIGSIEPLSKAVNLKKNEKAAFCLFNINSDLIFIDSLEQLSTGNLVCFVKSFNVEIPQSGTILVKVGDVINTAVYDILEKKESNYTSMTGTMYVGLNAKKKLILTNFFVYGK